MHHEQKVWETLLLCLLYLKKYFNRVDWSQIKTRNFQTWYIKLNKRSLVAFESSIWIVEKLEMFKVVLVVFGLIATASAKFFTAQRDLWHCPLRSGFRIFQTMLRHTASYEETLFPYKLIFLQVRFFSFFEAVTGKAGSEIIFHLSFQLNSQTVTVHAMGATINSRTSRRSSDRL